MTGVDVMPISGWMNGHRDISGAIEEVSDTTWFQEVDMPESIAADVCVGIERIDTVVFGGDDRGRCECLCRGSGHEGCRAAGHRHRHQL